MNISIKTLTRGKITHLVIDRTGLKVFAEANGKSGSTLPTNAEYRASYHFSVDSTTHEIICADLSHRSTTDAPALPELIKQIHRKIREASADSVYDTRYCHDGLLRKKIKPLIPSQSGTQYWPDQYHERNHAVSNQPLSGI